MTMASTFLLIGLMWIVFRAYLFSARRLNIFDIPNFRSSHEQITVRGAGILLPLAWIGFSLANGFFLPYFTTGLFLIALISFLDDIRSRTIAIRVGVHFAAIALAIFELYSDISLPWYTIPLMAVVFFTTINIVNFMDGINGMLGIQGLVFLLSLMVYKSRQADLDFMLGFQSPFPFLFAALAVFGYYNFRKKALVFSGDVGSISTAFIMIFVIACTVLGISLVTPSTVPNSITGEFVFNGFDLRYLLLLGVFYVDAGVTIVHRMILGEKITSSHRKHLYQFLVNEMKWPHLVVSSIYGIVQLGLSLLVVLYQPGNDATVVIGGLLLALYVTIRMRVIQEIARRELVTTGKETTNAELKTQDTPIRKTNVALAGGSSPLLPLDSVYNQQKVELHAMDSLPEEVQEKEPVEQADVRRKTFGKLSSSTSLHSNRLPYRKEDFNSQS